MSDDARIIFVKNLAVLMERRGVTQADICTELGVSSATVSNWCTGKKYPRIDVMQRLADFLRVNLSALTTDEGLAHADDADRLEALHQNPRLGLLFDRARRMSSADVEFMLQLQDRIMKERDND